MTLPRPAVLGLTLGFGLLGCDATEPSGTAEGEPPVTGTCTPTDDDSDPFADCVDALQAADGVSFGHDALDVVLGPPRPPAEGGGSLDVLSLGCGGSITVMLDGAGIVDDEGPDLLVFENAFDFGDSTFAEPARVLVSDDGEDWYEFECLPAGDGRRAPGCAGVTPTATAPGDGSFDPDAAGGDAFDLADVGLDRARWVRLIDVTEEHYGDDMWCQGAAGGFDLDAVAAAQPWPAPLRRTPAEER